MIAFVVLVLALLSAVECEKPLTRNKRFAAAYAGFPYGGFAGAGSFAGAGFPFSPFSAGFPFDYPRAPYVPFPYVPFPVINFPKPWYEGPNVCKEVRYANTQQPEEFGDFLSDDFGGFSDYSAEHETCKGSNTKYVCLKRSQDNSGQTKLEATKYQCCHGFVRHPSEPGCIEKPNQASNPNEKSYYEFVTQPPYNSNSRIDLKNLLPTLRSIGATQMVKMAQRASMVDSLHTRNYTIFSPNNSVLEAFVKGMESRGNKKSLKKPHRRRLKKKILYHDILTEHMVEGFYKLDDFMDGQLIDTESKKSKIRMNIYYIPEKVVTANCVPIVLADHFARNGIVHTVERVLPLPTRSVADIIAADAQFSELKSLLGQAGLVQTLRNPNKTFTVFAPTDSAFKRSRLKFRSKHKSRCLESAMKQHVLEHVVCSSAIPQYARSQTALGELVGVARDAHNKLYVEEAQIVARDLVATNGIVHVVDGVLTTRQAKVASEILEDYGLKEFLFLLESAHMKFLYDSLENVTFFIPSNEAIRAVPGALLQSLVNNIDSLTSILLYHVADGVAELSATSEQTFDSHMENTTIRVQMSSSLHSARQLLVQCATVLSSGNKICGGSLHVINKLLLPPKLSLMELLESLEEFSTMVLLLRATGLESHLRSALFTLLAPTDDAFHQIGGQRFVLRLLDNLPMATRLVKVHLLQGGVCCSRLRSDFRQSIRTLEGSTLQIERGEILRIGGARIVDCDMMASNGVLHMLDTVVRPAGLAPGTLADRVLMTRI